MKKIFTFLIMTALLVSMLSVVSATSTGTTIIAGKIYNADYTATEGGASVTINCNGNVQTVTSITSGDHKNGDYSVTYDESQCHEGQSLSVSAVKGSLTGYMEGTIHDDYPIATWNLAVVNVPLVPEFGAIVAGLTILGALGVFFVVRKK